MKYLILEKCIEKVSYPRKILRKDYLKDGRYPIISQEQDYINGYWDNPKDVFYLERPVVVFGDHTQVLKYIDFNFVLGADGVKILQPIEDLNAKYLYYFLLCSNISSLGYARHYRLIRGLNVPIHTLSEQQRIVALLDQALSTIDTVKSNTERNLENTRELFDNFLNSIFESRGSLWVNAKLRHVIQQTETINPSLRPEDEFTYIDVSSVNNKLYCIETTSIVKGKNAPSRARKLVKEGDIIFATVRPTLKRIAIIPSELDGQVCSTGYFVLRTLSGLINKYLFYYLRSNIFEMKMAELQKGASYPAVTDNELKDQVISFPKSLIEQNQIIAKLDLLEIKIKKLEENYQKILAKSYELKQSILHKAFSGEL